MTNLRIQFFENMRYMLVFIIIIYPCLAFSGQAQQRTLSESIVSGKSHNNNSEYSINTTKSGLYEATTLFTEFNNESIVGGGMQFNLYYRSLFIKKEINCFDPQSWIGELILLEEINEFRKTNEKI